MKHRSAILANEAFDPRGLARIAQSNERDVWHDEARRRVHDPKGTQRCASIRAISSILPQLKSLASFRSLPAIFDRVV